MSNADQTAVGSPSRAARWLLVPLLALIAAVTIVSPWGSPWSMDEATYLEMTRGIAEHGLPYTDNGPVERFPALQIPWNIGRDGRLWGAYPPVFPYFAAPFYLLGGPAAVVRANLALLGLLAIGVFLLTARLVVERPLIGTLAAYGVILGTPCAAYAMLPSSFVLAETLVVWACYFVLRATEQPAVSAGGGWAALAGLAAGLAFGTHMLAMVVYVAVIGALALPWAARSTVASWRRVPWRAWIPDALCRRRLGAALAASALPITAVALLNRLRFGSLNPVSYGPCVWPVQCGGAGEDVVNVLAKSLPVAVMALVALAALVAIRWAIRSRVATVAVLAAIAVAVLLTPSLRFRVMRLITIAAALLIDVEFETLTAPYVAADSGPGVVFGEHVVKAALQSMPMVGLAVLAWRRGRASGVWLVVLAVLAALEVRGLAVGGRQWGLGFPILHVRYTSLVAPLLVVLAAVAVAHLRWSKLPAIFGGLLTMGLGSWLYLGTDASLVRRLFLLRATLLLAACALLVAWLARSELASRTRARRAAPWLVACVFAMAVAINVGVDLKYFAHRLLGITQQASWIAEKLPPRFALLAHTERFGIHALSATRDIQYAEPSQAGSDAALHQLVRWWLAQKRPVYVLLPPHMPLEVWYGLPLVPIDFELGLYRVGRPARGG